MPLLITVLGQHVCGSKRTKLLVWSHIYSSDTVCMAHVCNSLTGTCITQVQHDFNINPKQSLNFIFFNSAQGQASVVSGLHLNNQPKTKTGCECNSAVCKRSTQ